ncbi:MULTISPECIES: MmgE/PrpD family protein [unclassified Halorubrum]|uniref:MmgE/PrpD family protein n=1 Tax=unclassified Halorubrum TaxID=2642239 RepID=UPI0010F871B7|nr:MULTISPECIES: MmgE/PrpD family protein [unclassified Halorubrum]TKX44521.1 MmgE/PrpD family protein [Halorubrum sp. ARQ200]TKX48598.1 MmgE/PrpD family protein [Halorubrum sp. ASP121]TKX62869.1 MmgE/PrpD family protein [Halorubrum sp. ASP1]
MVTQRIVDHCLSVDADRPDLPAHLLDWFAVAIGGATHADSTPAIRDGVRKIAGPTPDPENDVAATVLPSGERLTPADAALANGALAHSLDFDDTHLASSLHPGAPVIAAALAAAEGEGPETPADRFRAGVAAGYDVACTVGEAVGPDAHYDRGFHVTATCGTFGAVAAAGVVRGLDARELRDAFGIAGSQAAGSLQFLANGAWNKRLHAGLAARRGIEATDLAAAGVVGAADPLDGEHGFLSGYSDEPNPAAVDRIGEHDAVAETGRKPYPCCRYLHAAIDGLREIAPAVDPDAVEGIEIAIPSAGVRLTGEPIAAKRRPEGFVDCQFSAPFAAAVTLTEGTADAEAFLRAVGRLDGPPRWDDPAVRRLMGATSVETDPAIEARFPEEWGARVTVTAGGETREASVRVPLGEPEKPMSAAETEAKAAGLLAGSGVDADRLAAVVESLPERSVADLVDAATAE